MLQNKFERQLDLAIKPAKIFYAYVFLVFVFALISISLTASFSVTLRLVLICLLIFSVVRIVKTSRTESIARLTLRQDNTWQVLTKNHEIFEVELYGECIVTGFLIWLNLTTAAGMNPRKNFHVLLFPDSSGKNELRQLRVRLRFLKTTNTASEF